MFGVIVAMDILTVIIMLIAIKVFGVIGARDIAISVKSILTRTISLIAVRRMPNGYS